MDVTSSFNVSKSEILQMMKDENKDLKSQKLHLKELTFSLMKQLEEKQMNLEFV